MGIVFRPEGIKSYTTFRNGKKYDLNAWEEPPIGTPADVIDEAKRKGLKILENGQKAPLAERKDLDDLYETAPGFTVASSGRKSATERARARRNVKAQEKISPDAPLAETEKKSDPVVTHDALRKIPYEPWSVKVATENVSVEKPPEIEQKVKKHRARTRRVE